VPLAPFLFLPGTKTLALAIGVTGVALFAIGALLSLFTGKSALLSGLRMFALGSAAGGISYAVGLALGVSIA